MIMSRHLQISVIVLVCMLATVEISTYTGQNRAIFMEKMAEQAKSAEVALDELRNQYCQSFGDQLAAKPSAWPTIRTKCFESAVLELENVDPNDEFLYVKQANNLMALEMYVKCAKLSNNPCSDKDWTKTKKCLREIYIALPEFHANSVTLHIGDRPLMLSESIMEGMNVDKVVFERMMMGGVLEKAEITKCTAKTLNIAAL